MPFLLPAHFSPNKIILGLPQLSKLTEAWPSPRLSMSLLLSNLEGSPHSMCLPSSPGVSWVRAISGSQAAQSQEMVENSFRRASWLSVWKARFLRTLVLMDRTWEGGRVEAERRVHYKQQRAVSEALCCQKKDPCLSPNSNRLHEEFSSLSEEACPRKYVCTFVRNKPTREGKNVLFPLVPRDQGAFLSFLLHSKKGSGVMRQEAEGVGVGWGGHTAAGPSQAKPAH